MSENKTAADITAALKKVSTVDRARANEWFFKTGPGEYGEGDQFMGVTMPNIRGVIANYRGIKLSEVKKLINSPIHEKRMAGLLILVDKYKSGDEPTKKKVYDYYMDNLDSVNNWDLVDVTTPKIVGDYLLNRNKEVLYKLVKSKIIWERRVAVLATFTFIDNQQFDDALAIADILMDDKHDLIHKAVGWMLREIGKRDITVEEAFLDKHYKTMPRTALRYAIERMSESRRKHYMGK